MRCRLLPFIALIVLVLAVAFNSTVVAETDLDNDRNIRMNIVVRANEGPDGVTAEREYGLMLAPGRSGELVSGRMVPIPTTTFNTANSADGAIVPVTSFSYQTVGFQAQMELASDWTDDGRLRLLGHIEDSRLVRASAGAGRPEVETVQQKVDVYVRPGTPLVVHRSASSDSSVEIEMTAEVTE